MWATYLWRKFMAKIYGENSSNEALVVVRIVSINNPTKVAPCTVIYIWGALH
jgi:hypothetical protein